MKISYERLNQIIEEEVVRFKSLNEQVGLTPAQKLDIVKKKVSGLKIENIATIEKILAIVGTGE